MRHSIGGCRFDTPAETRVSYQVSVTRATKMTPHAEARATVPQICSPALQATAPRTLVAAKHTA